MEGHDTDDSDSRGVGGKRLELFGIKQMTAEHDFQSLVTRKQVVACRS